MTSANYKMIKHEKLIKSAAFPAVGRKFWTGGCFEDAQEHLESHPNDVCMVRYQDKIVLMGGPIESKDVLLDVTDHDFSGTADSFDVGEMTSLVEQWFQNDFNKKGKVFLFDCWRHVRHALSGGF